jgi:hypothetical protein
MKFSGVVVCLALTFCACSGGAGLGFGSSFGGVSPVLVPGLFQPASFQTTGVSTQCDGVLLPQLTIQTATKQQRVAWLALITRETYASAQAGGGINLIIADLPIGASYDQFSEARERYFRQEQLSYSVDESRSVLRQTLSPEQISAWVKCVTQDAVGLRVVLAKDSQTQTVATIYYRGTPGTRVKVKAQVTGGKFSGRASEASFFLPDHGSKALTVKRQTSQSDIYVIANSDSMSDSAVSFARIEAIPPPRCINPTLLSRDAAVTVSRGGTPSRITNGATDAAWNSGAPPPQWAEINLGTPVIIHHLRLIVEQLPTGYTEHRITGVRASGEAVVLGDLNTTTVSGGEYIVLVNDDAGRGIQRVKVETVKSPSWVAWREIEVYGCRGLTPPAR